MLALGGLPAAPPPQSQEQLPLAAHCLRRRWPCALVLGGPPTALPPQGAMLRLVLGAPPAAQPPQGATLLLKLGAPLSV